MKFMGCGDWTEQDQTLTVKSFPGWLLGRPVVNLQELGSVQCLYVPSGEGVNGVGVKRKYVGEIPMQRAEVPGT